MGQRRGVDERRCLRRTAPPSTTAQRSPGRGSGALFVYEEVLIHFLQVQSFVNSNTDIVPDHQSCDLLSIDEHDSERVTPGAKLWAGCVNTRWSLTRPCLHSLVTSGTAIGGLTERPCQFYTCSILRMLFSFWIASPK